MALAALAAAMVGGRGGRRRASVAASSRNGRRCGGCSRSLIRVAVVPPLAWLTIGSFLPMSWLRVRRGR
jgi:hypothetical protein